MTPTIVRQSLCAIATVLKAHNAVGTSPSSRSLVFQHKFWPYHRIVTVREDSGDSMRTLRIRVGKFKLATGIIRVAETKGYEQRRWTLQ